MRLLLAALALAACSPPPPPPVCGGVTLPPISLAAGGRAELVLDEALTAELVELAAPGVTTFREGDVLVVRAGYEAGTHTLTATCTTGVVTTSIDVAPLSMTLLAQWDAATSGAPGGREYFAWWADDTSVYLYGGFVFVPRQFTPSTEAFRFDLASSTWSPLTAAGTPPPPGGRVATDGASTLYFGGATLDTEGALDTPPTLAEVTHDGASLRFAPIDATGVIGSYTGALVHDAERGRWLSVCGAETRTLGLHCQVHAYSAAGGFQRLDVAGTPPPGRYGFHYALDAASDRVVVFGGQIGAGDTDLSGDTWVLELAPDDGSAPRWTQLFATSEGISARRNGAYAYDPESRRFFVWGGTADGRTPIEGLDVLTLDPGHETWTHVALPDGVPARASGGGVLDAAHDRILWGFGNSLAGIYTDLYALALAPPDGA